MPRRYTRYTYRPDPNVTVSLAPEPNVSIAVRQQYEQLRQEALKAATARIRGESGRSDILLWTFDIETLLIAKNWESSSTRKASWDWFERYEFAKYHYPKRFEVAVWEAGELRCMSVGRPVYQGMILIFELVEYSPPDAVFNPAAIMQYVLLAYETYARLINARQIRILEPNDADRDYCRQHLGFGYCLSKNYLYKYVVE